MKISPEIKTDLLKRLKRLEGQVRGVQKMLDEDRDCREALQQLAAGRSAAPQATPAAGRGEVGWADDKASVVVVREHAAACLFKSGGQVSPQEVLDSLVSVLEKV